MDFEAGLPILCEKPLAPDPETSWQILQAEQKGGDHRVQGSPGLLLVGGLVVLRAGRLEWARND